ncbi:MAG: GAP family protein [Myxococcota bacterium]
MESILLRALASEAVGLLTPAPVLFVLLLLATRDDMRRAVAYTLGYALGYGVIGGIALVAGPYLRSPPGAGEASGAITPFISIALGVVLLSFGVRTVRRGRSEAAGRPKFLTMFDTLSTSRAFGFGTLTSVMLFQNLGIFMMSLTIVIDGGLPLGSAAVVVLAMVALFCSPCLVPLVLRGLFAERGRRWLGAMKRFLDRHHRIITMTAMFVMGSSLVLRGLLAWA